MAFFRLFALVFRHFAWRISFFRLALFRLFVISLGVFSLFRLFAWRYFVLAPRHNARRKDERTKWHKHATISSAVISAPFMLICMIQSHAGFTMHALASSLSRGGRRFLPGSLFCLFLLFLLAV